MVSASRELSKQIFCVFARTNGFLRRASLL